MGGRAEAGEPVGGEEAGVWGQALHKPGEGRGGQGRGREPSQALCDPASATGAWISVAETQLPRTCISTHSPAPICPSPPYHSPRPPDLLCFANSLDFVSQIFLDQAAPCHPLYTHTHSEGNLLAAQLHSLAGCACGPLGPPTCVLCTWQRAPRPALRGPRKVVFPLRDGPVSRLGMYITEGPVRMD